MWTDCKVQHTFASLVLICVWFERIARMGLALNTMIGFIASIEGVINLSCYQQHD